MIKMYLKNKLKPVNLTTLLYEIEENETYLLTTSVMNPLNRVKSPVKMWWHTVTHGRGSEGETGELSG